MENETFKHILNMPEVLGLALIQGRIINYFYLKDKIQSPEEKLILIRKIRNTSLETATSNKEKNFYIENYFLRYFEINKILGLLVIEKEENVRSLNIISALLKRDFDSSSIIEIFKSLSKTVKYSPSEIPSNLLAKEVPEYSLKIENEYAPSTINDVIKALNLLSEIICRYLGEKITANVWQLCRPPKVWFQQFEIVSPAKVIYKGSSQDLVSPLQHLWIREWTNSVIKECSQIIHDLPNQIDRDFPENEMRRYISVIPLEYLSNLSNTTFEKDTLFDEYNL